MNLSNFYKNKKVLITGNTGFKGAWLSLYLHHLGAEVYGLSQNRGQELSIFETCEVERFSQQFYADIDNFESVDKVLNEIRPDIIFHLAAQAITLLAYEQPLQTFRTNGIGTANILESLRLADYACDAIIVTSDKCYRNNEWVWGYRENDMLMGIDPYSASKSVAEIISNSYFHSFFKHSDRVRISSCRAGNVIGGGDWNAFRIVPDCIRAWMNKEPITIRNPKSIRPWNYILDVLSGYLMTEIELANGSINGEAFNFGPQSESEISVIKLVETLWEFWNDHSFEPYRIATDEGQFFEHEYLKLNSEKAHSILGWSPMTSIRESLAGSSKWYKAYLGKSTSMHEFTLQMIADYNQTMLSLDAR